jgi:hypothetical protein
LLKNGTRRGRGGYMGTVACTRGKEVAGSGEIFPGFQYGIGEFVSIMNIATGKEGWG